MGTYGDSRLAKASTTNPAGPAGLGQTATRLDQAQAQYESGGGQRLQPWMPQGSMLETAKSWYAGANSEGTKNGWDTDFYATALGGTLASGQQVQGQYAEWQNKAAQEGRGSRFFDWLDTRKNPNATGVATWEDQSRGIRFGDVFNGGKKVGNLYDDYDQATADVMVGEFLFSNDEKERMFRDPNRQQVYRTAVEERKVQETDRAKYSKSAEDFDRDVKATEDAWHGVERDAQGNVVSDSMGAGEVGTVLGGVAGGTALGAGIGTMFGGPLGTLIGGVIGGVAGGVSSFLNQDQLIEVGARAWEVTDRANQMYGTKDGIAGNIQTIGIGIQEFSGLAMKFIAPVSNTVQGIYDWKHGDIGDATSEFYAMDPETGQRKRNGWWQALDLTATLGDSALQFSSGYGIWAYMGTMMGNVGGNVVGMTTGAGFNDMTGQFDEYDGWREWGSAIGSLGIDVVQLGTAGAIAKAGKSVQAAFGKGTVSTTEASWIKPVEKATDKLYGRLGRGEATENAVNINGMRFFLDDAGNAVGARATIELLAPSEFMRWIPTGWRARTMRDLDGGAVGADDMFRAAMEMTRHGSTFRTSLMTGYAEGAEEFAQAILDPGKFGHDISWDQVLEATLYGAASGMGMGAAGARPRPKQADIEKAQARFHYTSRTGHNPTDAEWDQKWSALTAAEKKRLVVSTTDEDAQVNEIMKTYAGMHQIDVAYASPVGLAASEDMRGKWAEVFKRAQKEGNGSLAIMGRTSNKIHTPYGTSGNTEHAANSAVMTAWEMVNQLLQINQGMKTQLENLQNARAAIEARHTAEQDANEKENLAREVIEYTKRIEDLRLQESVSDQVSRKFGGLYAAFRDEQDGPSQLRLIGLMNKLVQDAYKGIWKDNDGNLLPADQQHLIKRAVEFKLSRHPHIDSGSYALLMPQISAELTRMNMHGTVYIAQATLKALGADHDGDTAVPLHDMYSSEEELKGLRRGSKMYVHEVENKDPDNPDARMNEKTYEVLMDVPDAEQVFIETFRDMARRDPSPERMAVVQGLNKLNGDIRTRYTRTHRVVDPRKLDVLLAKFKDDVMAGVPDARVQLVQGLYNIDDRTTNALLTLSDQTHIQEPLWLWSQINDQWDQIQRNFSYLNAQKQEKASATPGADLPKDNAYLKEKARKDAATAGQTQSMLGPATGVRQGQILHYSALYNAAIKAMEAGGFLPEQHQRLIWLYENLGRGETQSETEKITGRYAIEDRVHLWLTKIANSVENTTLTQPEIILMLSQTRVPDVQFNVEKNVYTQNDGSITLLQLLLRKSLEIESNTHRAADEEADVRKKIKKLERLTYAGDKHSYTANKALVEVFRGRALHQLMGTDSMYLGPQMTVGQLEKMLTGLGTLSRDQMVASMRRAPAYFSEHGVGDPPWFAAEMHAGRVNAFTILVDAVATSARTNVQNLQDQNETAHRNFLSGFRDFQNVLVTWRQTHDERLSKEKRTSDRQVLRDMLKYNPDIAKQVATLIPDAARLGVFHKIGNSLHTAKWVEEMLLQTDAEKAAVMLFVHTRIAEFNVLGGTVDPDKADRDKQNAHPAGTVDPTRIKSRFNQIVYELAKQPDGTELSRLLLAAGKAESLESLFDTINNEPNWVKNRQALMPYHDDVATFEIDPKDVWNAGLPGVLQRENLKGWATRMAVSGQIALEEYASLETDKNLLANTLAYANDNTVDTDGASIYYGLVDRAIKNRKKFPDANGPIARDQIVQLLQHALIRMHDKGKADEAARGYGEPLVTMDGFGYSNGVLQELAALTDLDFEDIRTNPTKLVDGPIRVMLPDGTRVRIDMSDTKQALEMLADPRTQAFAKAVLFPTVRDVDKNNNVQHYQDVSDTRSIKDMLMGETHKHLFDQRSGPARVRQAHEYIGLVEAHIRRQALGRSEEEQAKMFMPVQNLINEFVIAYTHSPVYQDQDPEALRNDLIVNVAEAIKAVEATSADLRQTLKDALAASMKEVYAKDSTALESFLESAGDKKLLRLQMHRMITDSFDTELTRIDKDLRKATKRGDRAEMTRLTAEKNQVSQAYKDALKDPVAQIRQLEGIDSVLNTYGMTGDPGIDATRKTMILDFISKKNRINRIRDKDVQTLVQKVRAIKWEDPVRAVVSEKDITAEEWDTLTGWVVSSYISERAARASSGVPLAPVILGEKGEEVRRYFDQSWSYLLDGLFDQNVLNAASELAISGQYSTQNSQDTTKDILLDGLLNQRHFGLWTDRIPMESMKARQMMLSSPVGAAIQVEGNDPKRMADFVGSGMVSYNLPEPGHMSTETLIGTKGQSLRDVLGPIPMAYIKLQNHFVNRLTISYMDASGNLQTVDLMDVAQQNFSHSIVENSGYRVLDLSRLEDRIQKMQQSVADGGVEMAAYQIDVDYVDVDKQPHERDWANNIFFDGVGRESLAGNSGGPISAMFFALFGLSKLGQQGPLDMAAKKGKQFRQHVTTSLQEVLTLEQAGAPIAEILGKKALHMWRQSYPTGELLNTDLPALYKIMKMRHVVIGTNAHGDKEVWWPEKVIELQQKNATVPLQNMQLVPLSESVAQTLRGGAGHEGIKGVLTRPVLNVQDMDPFPSLDKARLSQLGLSRLGEDGDVGNSDFAKYAPLPKALSKREGVQGVRSLYRERVSRWRREGSTIRKTRMERREKGKGKFDISRINEKNAAKLMKMLQTDALAARFKALGVPFMEMMDPAALRISQYLAAQIDKAMEDHNSMIWQHVQGQAGNLSEGILSQEDVESDFTAISKIAPTYGDVIVLNLDSFRVAAGSLERAEQQAQEIIREYARRGVMIVLGSESGDGKLRDALSEWLVNGSLDYKAMAHSAHIFMPVQEDPEDGVTRAALESTPTEVPRFTAKNISLGIQSSEFTELSENNTHYDVENDRSWRRISHMIMPSALVGTGGINDRIRYAFNIPVKNRDGVDQKTRVSAILQKQLATDEGIEHFILQSAGPDKVAEIQEELDQFTEQRAALLSHKSDLLKQGHPTTQVDKDLADLKKKRDRLVDRVGDPAGTRKYRENKNGTYDPGVLGLRDALVALREKLEVGNFPTDKGQVLMTGSIVPLVAGNQIMLSRVGYQLPDMERMSDMLAAPLGKQEKTAGVPALGIAISTAKRDKNQTVPPMFTIDEIRDDPQHGLSLVGSYEQGDMAKMINEGVGFKSGMSPLPSNLKFPEKAMSANGTRVTQILSRQSVENKEATAHTVNNFSDAFAVTGVDFRGVMLDFFYGQGRDKKKEAEQWDVVQTVLEAWSRMPKPYSAADIDRALDSDSMALELEAEINAIGQQLIGGQWSPVQLQASANNPTDPVQRFAHVLIASLAAPGIELQDVIEATGLMSIQDRNSEAVVTVLPRLFTDALNNPAYPELRDLLFDKLNSNMPKDDATDQPIYSFDHQFNFYIRMQDAGVPVLRKGQLQMLLAIPANENAVSLTQAALGADAPVSAHVTRVGNATIGGFTVAETKPDDPDLEEKLYGSDKIMRFEEGDGGTFWQMMTRTAQDEVPYTPWERNLPMQDEHYRVCDKKVRIYTTSIKKDEWKRSTEALKLANDLLDDLNLPNPNGKETIEVDYLVRQFLGRPGAAEGQEEYVEHITDEAYIQAIILMRKNLVKGLHPLHGGQVPYEHHDFWRKVFNAQQNVALEERWAPIGKEGKHKVTAETWEEWCLTLLGQVKNSNSDFHSMYRTALDGFWHTYQGTTPVFNTQAASMEELANLKLMDPDTNRLFLSLDPGQHALLSDPVVIDTVAKTYDALMGHDPSIVGEDAKTAEHSPLGDQLIRQQKWLEGQKLGKQKQVSVKDYIREGAHYQESSRETNVVLRNMINLSITMRLANPALWVSALFEVPFRNALEHTTDLLTGGGTSIVARGQAIAPGVNARFTNEEITMLRNLAKQLGTSNRWLGAMFDEMAYKGFAMGAQAEGAGRITRFLERTSRSTARLTSDPRWGMKGTSAADRYIAGAWEYLSMTDNQITVTQFCKLLRDDPLWLQKQAGKGKGSAHSMGANRLAQVRSTKATVASKIIMKPLDTMCDSGSATLNGAGHFLKIPFLFTRFNMNALMTITGLNALDTTAAMFFDQRRKPELLKRMSALARKETYDPDFAARMDLSDVLDGIDLSRVFVRSMVTQTGLMMAGMLAGNLGLGGEDEEERKRRRLAHWLNIPYYLDPREAQNDFRWTDAIFLDNVPILDTIFRNETGHSAVVPHWILRQFLSPVLGMGRFFETGDVREISHGFWDAASAIPNSITNLWTEADMTARLLAEAAQDPEGGNTPEVQSRNTQLFVNIVGMYEKALIENSFINSVINGKDKYDRDPWVVPMTADENTGELDRQQGSDLPQPTDALIPYQTEGDDPENRAAYMTRRGMDAQLHAYSENNHTAAMLMSLFTGQWGRDSDYLRQNMAPKVRTVQTAETTKQEAEALIAATYMGLGSQQFMTKDEIVRKLQMREQAAGRNWDQADLESEAEQIWEVENGPNHALSIFKDGEELIAKDGAKGVFKSLQKGLINFRDPALAGISISFEMREEIAEEWMTELIQEGVDLGLSEQSAGFRARRLWYGDDTDPTAPGLRELLFSKDIPYKNEAKYNQLNVMYVLGPDGLPWATPFQRQGLAQSLGIPLPHTMAPSAPGTTKDARGNTVDLVRGINTGQAALEPVQLPEPTDKPLEKALSKSYTPSRTPYGRRGYGGGGGGGGDYWPPFQRMMPLPDGTAPRTDNIPMINTQTPYIRRASIHRQRIQSERGRLKQWQ